MHPPIAPAIVPSLEPAVRNASAPPIKPVSRLQTSTCAAEPTPTIRRNATAVIATTSTDTSGRKKFPLLNVSANTTASTTNGTINPPTVIVSIPAFISGITAPIMRASTRRNVSQLVRPSLSKYFSAAPKNSITATMPRITRPIVIKKLPPFIWSAILLYIIPQKQNVRYAICSSYPKRTRTLLSRSYNPRNRARISPLSTENRNYIP